MPEPKPKKGESESEFVSRCISEERHSGNDMPDEQLQGMCYNIYRDWKDDNKSESADTPEITNNRFFKEGDVIELDGKIGVIKRIISKKQEVSND